MQSNNPPPLEWLRHQVLLLLRAVVQYLESKERKLSLFQKKIYLLVFLVTFGGFFAWCLVAGITGRSNPAMKVTPIKRPLLEHQLRQDTIQNQK